LNPAPVVRWNCDKHYLRELAAAALPVVPTTFIEAGAGGKPPADARAALAGFLAQHDCAELVVKPAVGAGSRDTRRHARTAVTEILAQMTRLLTEGRSMMMQPYLEGVDHEGETALIFIDGCFSHAVRKGPLLPPGAPATAALFAPEDIRPRAAADDEVELATRIMQYLPFGTLLYARVDLIRDAAGEPRLLELELTEPSLFFAHAPRSATRFAGAALARLARV
jgi:O-ureido-D-serine cyclo-ligase